MGNGKGNGSGAGIPPETWVVIFGAGVTGLTAAHELAERGIRVTVYDVNEDPFRPGEVQVGGMARTQWSHVKRERMPIPGDPPRLQPSLPIELVHQKILFDDGSATIP